MENWSSCTLEKIWQKAVIQFIIFYSIKNYIYPDTILFFSISYIWNLSSNYTKSSHQKFAFRDSQMECFWCEIVLRYRGEIWIVWTLCTSINVIFYGKNHLVFKSWLSSFSHFLKKNRKTPYFFLSWSTEKRNTSYGHTFFLVMYTVLVPQNWS